MSTSPVMSVTDELVAELDTLTCVDHGGATLIRSGDLRALLAERAELKRDAEFFRLFLSTVIADCNGDKMTPQQSSLFGEMNRLTHVDESQLRAMFDTAMQSEQAKRHPHADDAAHMEIDTDAIANYKALP